MKSFYSWYRKHITGAIFTGLILGILTGLFLAGRFEPVLTVTSLIGSIYMNALNMMIFPMVFCSIVIGICSIGNARTTGKITAASMIFFLCTTALASLCGLIIPRLIHLGEGRKIRDGNLRYPGYRDEQHPGHTEKPDPVQPHRCICQRKHASGSGVCPDHRFHTDRSR